MKKLLLFIAFYAVCFYADAQSFTATYTFDAVNTTSGKSDPTPLPVVTGVSFGVFAASAGVSANPASSNGRFNFTNFPTGATNGSNVFTGGIDLSRYYEVTIGPSGSSPISLSTIKFSIQRTAEGVRQFSVRSSLDGYSSNLPASISGSHTNESVVAQNVFQITDASVSQNTGPTITLPADLGFAQISSPVTFRFYGFNAESAAGNFSIEDVAFTGATSDPVVISPPKFHGPIMYGMSAQGISWTKWKANDAAIAESRNQAAPFVPLRHSYDSDFPATWAQSAAAAEAGYGVKVSLLNVKCDWAKLASGEMDSRIVGFINSIPEGVKIILSINHEPENDKGGNPTLADRDLWAKGQARASRVVYANASSAKCEYASCLMGYTFQDGSGRNPADWNPGKYMTAAEKANHIFGVDVYFTMPKSGPGPNCEPRAANYVSDAHAFGFSRLGILETGLDNSNGNTDEACADWMIDKFGKYVSDPAKGIEFVAWFNATSNPASFDPLIDSDPERKAFADLVMGITEDTIPPVVHARKFTAYLDATGNVSVPASAVDSASSDNFYIHKLALSPATFSCANIGLNTAVLSASDRMGNTASTPAYITVLDTVPPVAISRNITVRLSGGVASIAAADIDSGSYDACGISSVTLSKSTFTCEDRGDNTVLLNVTDMSGNTATAQAIVHVTGAVPKPVITVSKADTTYTGLGLKAIAIGYGAQTIMLSATDTSSVSMPSSYAWAPVAGLSALNIPNPAFTPATAGTYNLTVTITNQFGCKEMATITITVIDVRCGNKNDKVVVCNNSGKDKQNCVSPQAVDAFLRHGGSLGSCTGYQPALTANTTESFDILIQPVTTLLAYPNPIIDQTTINFSLRSSQPLVELSLYNGEGLKIKTVYKGAGNAGQSYRFTLDTSSYKSGLYYLQLSSSTENTTFKLVKNVK